MMRQCRQPWGVPSSHPGEGSLESEAMRRPLPSPALLLGIPAGLGGERPALPTELPPLLLGSLGQFLLFVSYLLSKPFVISFFLISSCPKPPASISEHAVNGFPLRPTPRSCLAAQGPRKTG